MGNASSHSRSSSSTHSPGNSTPANGSSALQPAAMASSSSHFSLSKKNRDRSASSATLMLQNEIVDGGRTVPQGLYQVTNDFSQTVVRQLIVDRKLAPFYPGLEDHEDDWAEDEVVQAIRESRAAVATKAAQMKADEGAAVKQVAPKTGPTTDSEKKEALWYREEAAECPLCFLYYPSNINTSRCCDQPICTECFVQIKRADATATHLESEPACCPFCMEPNFGIVYTRPRPKLDPSHASTSASALDSDFDPATSRAAAVPESKRRKSVNHTAREVVTIDEIRPDWESKLEAVKAIAARRANRRIVMRQVGDRLIPVGITSSRDPLQPLQIGPDGESSGRRQGGGSSRRTGGDVQALLAGMGGIGGMGGSDIEDLMILEAMRLSLLEEDQRQAREAAKTAAAGGSGEAQGSAAEPSASSSSSSRPTGSASYPSSSMAPTAPSHRAGASHPASPSPPTSASTTPLLSSRPPPPPTDTHEPVMSSGMTPSAQPRNNPFDNVPGQTATTEETPREGTLIDF